AVGYVCAAESGKRTEQESLAELKNLGAPPAKKDLHGLDADEVREYRTRRARSTLKVVAEFEQRFPKSADLAAARSAALTAVGSVGDPGVGADSAQVARALAEYRANGSENAAH